jgi:hypothetical protein
MEVISVDINILCITIIGHFVVLHINQLLSLIYTGRWGHAVAVATNRKVAGSSPDDVEFFN